MGARLNGIQEVTGSIPVRSTNLRSPASMSELRLASHPSMFQQVRMDVVPVVFGAGTRYFGSVHAQHLLEVPDVVIQGVPARRRREVPDGR